MSTVERQEPDAVVAMARPRPAPVEVAPMSMPMPIHAASLIVTQHELWGDGDAEGDDAWRVSSSRIHNKLVRHGSFTLPPCAATASNLQNPLACARRRLHAHGTVSTTTTSRTSGASEMDGDALVRGVTKFERDNEQGDSKVRPPARRRSSVCCGDDTFEVRFGDGFLGIEFAVNVVRQRVVVKSVRRSPTSQRGGMWPLGATITIGLEVDAINQCDVAAMSPEDVLEMLRLAPRPLILRFRKSAATTVVCKLCECQVDAARIDEHVSVCILSRRLELEIDQTSNLLSRCAAAIKDYLQRQIADQLLSAEEIQFFEIMRAICIQAASCNVAQVDSFALCARLRKMLNRMEHSRLAETSTLAATYGSKYCLGIRKLLYAKMCAIRQTHKVLLQHSPIIARTPLRRAQSFREQEHIGTEMALPEMQQSTSCRVSIRDFQIVKPISKGAFGKVFLARKKTTGDQYALKVLAKEHLVRKKQIHHIETERNILARIESPFVVKLFWTFQTRRNLFLVMEYLPGGDFMSLLECIVQLEEEVARIYIAEVALALNHLHSKGCVHRDLKPDNILISCSGHIKLTDFGLSEEGLNMSESDWEEIEDEWSDRGVQLIAEVPADFVDEVLEMMDGCVTPGSKDGSRVQKQQRRVVTNHSYGRCGTPDYLSPEIVLGQPHGPPVDYWALGVILYEMLVGFPPFNDDSVEAIFHNILDRQILWPDGDKCLSPEAMDLINRLLEMDPAKRLGWEGLRHHPFFDGLDWETLLESTPPFVPTLEGPTDTSYFNNRNLTDICIDDEEFEADDSKLNDQEECEIEEDSSKEITCDDRTDEDSDEDVMKAFAAIPRISSGDSQLNEDEWLDAGIRTVQYEEEGGGHDENEDHEEDQDEDQEQVDLFLANPSYHYDSSLKFPSGMYELPPGSHMKEVFRAFSFTNMNALIAASRTEAEVVAATSRSELVNPSLSIVI